MYFMVEVTLASLAINTLVKSESICNPKTHAFPNKGLSSYQHLFYQQNNRQTTDGDSSVEIPPFHSCTVSYIPTLLFLSFIWYVFYSGGDTHTEGYLDMQRERERERGRRVLVPESLDATVVPSQK